MPHAANAKSTPLTPKNAASFQWTSWLPSPKRVPQYQRPGNCQSDNDDDGSPARSRRRRRPRGASFDQTEGASAPPTERAGESYFVGLRDNFERSGVLDMANSEDSMSLVTMSRSVETDDAQDDRGGGHPGNSRSSRSLLTAFLFQLNSLLPEYCDHLSAATSYDTGNNSTGGASEAVALLERGGKAISAAFFSASNGAGKSSPQCSPIRTTRPSSAVPSSAPSSPSYLVDSLAQKCYLTPPKSDSATESSSPNNSSNIRNKVAPDISHWILPLSPRSNDSQERRLKGSHKKRSKKKYSGMTWNSIAESEWERFVSPFLMLVGAECLYAKMEHVLDPKISVDSESPSPEDKDNLPVDRKVAGGGKEDCPSFVKFAMQQVYRRMEHVIDPKYPTGEVESSLLPKDDFPPALSFSKDVTFATQEAIGGQGERNETDDAASDYFLHRGNDPAPPADTDRRGSRRLVSMYRQIREDLIIVGEYLCDPVLGARGGTDDAGRRGRGCPVAHRMPPPPLHLDSRSSSPMKDGANRAKSRSDGDEFRTAHMQRELAAISMRHTLDALISFIEGRIVLIRIHAELCCLPPQVPHPSVEVGGGCGPRGIGNNNAHSMSVKSNRSTRWVALAEQCRSVSEPVSAWAKERDWKVVSNLERELKAMELALTSIHYLFECDLFNTILNVRRLHVLLNKAHAPETASLPMMYIQSCLPELLSIMHIYFADAGSTLDMLRSSGRRRSSRSVQPSGLPSNRKSWNKLDDAAAKKSPAKSKVTDYSSLFAEFIGNNENGPPLAIVVAHGAGGRSDSASVERQGDDDDDEEYPGSVSCWEPLYMKSNVKYGNFETGGGHLDDKNSIFKRGQGPKLVRILKQNFSIDRETNGAKTDNTNVDDTARTKHRGMGMSWPFHEWPQIEKVLTKHSSATSTTDVAKHCIESSEEKTSAFDDVNGEIRRRSSTSEHSNVISHCHISSITDSMCLIVIQGVGDTKKQRASDDDILLFMRSMVSKLCPENLLNIKVLMRLKSDSLNVRDGLPPDRSKTLASMDSHMPATSLWSESGWSDAQRKKILHSLGLRRKNSPVMAPLKSPYVKRQMSGGRLGRQRKKKMKNSINHAHLEFFLGPELSQLI